MNPTNQDAMSRILKSLSKYSAERRRFLKASGWADSNRDPFSVVSESITICALGGRLAGNQVQARWDLIDAEGHQVQVKYLANSGDRWKNEHHVKFPVGVERYALVVFEQHLPRTLLIFRRDRLADLCRYLGKRHGNQHNEVQFTQHNYESVLASAYQLEKTGVLKILSLA